MIQRNERLSKAIRGEGQPPNGEVDTSLEESPSKTAATEDATSKKDDDKDENTSAEPTMPLLLRSLDEQVKELNAQVVSENKVGITDLKLATRSCH